MNRTLPFRLTRVVVGVSFVASLAVAAVAFRLERTAHMEGRDGRLRAAASSVPLLLPPDFHERALHGEVSESEHLRVLARLESQCAAAGVSLLYTYVRGAEGEGGVFIAVGTATPEMKEAGEALGLMTPDATPPPGVFEAFETGRIQFSQYRSQYGAFRSCFLPGDTASGLRYVVGADDLVADVRGWLLSRLAITLGAAMAVSLVVGAIGARMGRRIAAPFVELAGEVDHLEYDEGDEEREGQGVSETLRALAAGEGESGRLARALVAMHDRLMRQVEVLREATAARERVEAELEIARRIQEALLPGSPPSVPGFDVRGWSREMDQVGGDFYFWLGRRQVTVIIADVTGHGLASALIAATCRARAEAIIDGDPRPASALSRLNAMMSADLIEGRFVTLAAATIDPETATVTIGSAGHGPILHRDRRTSRVTRIESTGLPLGVIPEQDFDDDHTIAMQPGDLLVLVSDGVTERADRAGELYGEKRLNALLEREVKPGMDAQGVIDLIRADVEAFGAGVAQSDDTTAVVIRRAT